MCVGILSYMFVLVAVSVVNVIIASLNNSYNRILQSTGRF